MISTSTFNAWATCPKPNTQAHLRLFCFPYAGGGASMFSTWSDNLPAEIEVYAIQLPGRESRLMEPPFTRLSPLVQTLAYFLYPYLQKPFAFFGHSMGSLISFELARYLRREQGLAPMHLFVSGHRAPQIPDPNPPIHQLPETAFIEKLRKLNGTPELVIRNTELMQHVLPVLLADFAICETYVYSPEKPLTCSISALGGLQDGEASHGDLLAWRAQTQSFFTLHMLPGNHFFLHSARASLLRAISLELTRLSSQLTRGQQL